MPAKPMAPSVAEDCAARIMEVIPLLMRSIVHAMQQRHAGVLTLPQFRALMIVSHHDGASLSLVAEHLGSTLSATSKLIDGLVERGLLTRETVPEDRRRLTLGLTAEGRAMLEAVHAAGKQQLAHVLGVLSDEECRAITAAIQTLHGVVVRPRTTLSQSEKQQGG